MLNSNHGFVRCAMANFTGNLSSIEKNGRQIGQIIMLAQNQGASILVFPELALTGYSCQDLLGNSQLMDSIYSALNDIKGITRNTLVLVGAPIVVDDIMYNCAIAIRDHEIIGVIPKQFIPSHNQFYEKRWFTPYTNPSIKEIKVCGKNVPFGNIIFSSSLGYKLGVEIGEDLFSVIPPSSYLALAGANIIANLSASSEQVGQDDYRRELIKAQSSRTISAYLYTSAGFFESSSDLVFGGSGYAFENGEELASFERFQIKNQLEIFDVDVEHLRNERINNKIFSDSKRNLSTDFSVVEFFQTGGALQDNFARKINAHPFMPNMWDKDAIKKTCEEVFSIQSTALARRLKTTNSENVVLGISGGLDSTLALLVCCKAFDKLDWNYKRIHGITMPGFGTTGRTYNNAVKLCKTLGVTLKEIPIRDACMQHFKDIGHDPDNHDITYENVQARERTQILMDVANQMGGFVVGTGDLSEMALGWCTYNGDHMSMYNVNCSIPKTLIRPLINWYAHTCALSDLEEILSDITDTPISPELLPTDGEKVVQRTESAVGPYEVIDFFIYHFVRNKFSKEKIIFLAEKAFSGTYTRHQLIDYWNDFIKRFFRNQFKRNCVPDGPKVGSVDLSPRGGWRMPSDADFSEWIIKT